MLPRVERAAKYRRGGTSRRASNSSFGTMIRSCTTFSSRRDPMRQLPQASRAWHRISSQADTWRQRRSRQSVSMSRCSQSAGSKMRVRLPSSTPQLPLPAPCRRLRSKLHSTASRASVAATESGHSCSRAVKVQLARAVPASSEFGNVQGWRGRAAADAIQASFDDDVNRPGVRVLHRADVLECGRIRSDRQSSRSIATRALGPVVSMRT